ncbi:MAG TPA: hypothetical protein V6D08_21490 [Candidatus Obscuribacterales bacterium]
MSKLVLLDTIILGLATNPKGTVNGPVLKSINRLIRDGHQPFVPEIADYELRRELIRIGSKNAIERLNALGAALGYIPLHTQTMRRAAELWAQARPQGHPLAHEHALDGDVILGLRANEWVNGAS